jgi:hypothetical protein
MDHDDLEDDEEFSETEDETYELDEYLFLFIFFIYLSNLQSIQHYVQWVNLIINVM